MSTLEAGEPSQRYWTRTHQGARSPATTLQDARVIYAGSSAQDCAPSAYASAPFEDAVGGAAKAERRVRAVYAKLPATGSHSPFQDVVETKVFAARVSIQSAIGKTRLSAIRERLLELVDIAAEEYPDTEIPNEQTLDSVLGFFLMRRDLREPSIALTSTGGVWVEWRSGDQHSAALEFLRNGSVNLAAFFPDLNEPMRSSSLAASLSWRSAAREIRVNPSLRWIRSR